MKKIGLGILITLTVLALSGVATAMLIPAADQVKEVAAAPDNSPVITESDGDWMLQPYYVMSDSPTLKALLGVNYEFDGVFSTELDSVKLGLLKILGVKTEPVQIYQITGKPYCGDGFLHPSEDCEALDYSCPTGYTCNEKCKCVAEEGVPEERTCYPDNQKPWGILKVNGGSGGTGVSVAVLDTGVDTDHPDLSYIDCVTKVTHFKPDTKSCEDKNGHGTHVSGTVLANAGSDTLGIYGVAPEASLIAVKVCDRRGWCYGDDMAAGIYYAADKEADIISMSIGGDTPDSQVLAAIDYAVKEGVLVVAAAGNDRGDGVGLIDYPGAYVKVIAVAAFDSSNTMASFSSLGVNDGDWAIEEKEIEFAAPGVNVESTWNDGCYKYLDGTSMSTPHVTGIAARDWQGSASATRVYLQGLAKSYTTTVFDYGQAGDDIEAGFGLPIK